MIIGDNDIDFEKRNEEFLKYKDTLPKEPEGNVKKEYYVGCYSGDDWKYVHEILTQDGTLEDNIPQDSCECCNDCRHSETRGIYLLTDTEAEQLRNHPRVHYVHINTAKYPGTYLDNPNDISTFSKQDRYSSTVKHQRYISGSTITPSVPDSSLLNRGSYQLKRHQQRLNPWGSSPSTIFDDKIQQYGDGSDIDIIVCDQDMWFGHIEFQNRYEYGTSEFNGNVTNIGELVAPKGYRGGNVLPGNGSCDLLDLVLDAPYYLDPDFFNADPNTRLMTRWDGTIVPVESYARNWWSQNSLTYRSSKFVSPSNGGTAAGVNDFGTITITSLYTRARCNGSNTAYHTGSGSHGTPCASLAYGRQYGWAYNANKWFLNFYGSGSNSYEVGFDLQKIFHQIKPINSSYGTKNPTISSNSWGLRQEIREIYASTQPHTITTDIDTVLSTANIFEFSLNTNWSHTSVSGITTSVSIKEQEPYPTGMFFKPEGNKCYIIGSNKILYEYNITNWNISTLSYSGNSFSLANNLSNVIVYGISFKPEGDKLYILTSNSVREFTLTNWNISTIQQTNNIINISHVRPGDLCFKPDGTRLFIISNNGNESASTNTIYQYNLSPAWNIGTASYEKATGITNNIATGIAINDDGSSFYSLISSNTNILQRISNWDTNVNWDIGNLTYNTNLFFNETQITNPQSIFFKPDGSKFYTISDKKFLKFNYKFRDEEWKSFSIPIIPGGKNQTYPNFMNYYNNEDGVKRRVYELTDGHSAITAGKELIESGVIFVAAAGNNNQKLVKSNHPDYNNYHARYAGLTFQESTTPSIYASVNYHPAYNSHNRPGFPIQISKDISGNYRCIIVGALDDLPPLESKASYSNMGNAVDCFFAADNVLSAKDDNSSGVSRYDNYYYLNGNKSVISQDGLFNGTSAACPVCAGFIATKLQYNRDWTIDDLKNWISQLSPQTSEEGFYFGGEATTSSDSLWDSTTRMHGNLGIVPYDDALTTNEPGTSAEISSISNVTPTEGNTITIQISTDLSSGTYYYSIEPAPGSSISANDFVNNSLTGSFNVSSGTGTITIQLSSNPSTEGTERFRLRIRELSTTGDIIATSEYIAVTDNIGGQAPTDISLSALTFNEGISANTTIATISATDPDAGDTFTFSLVSGTGSTDNSSFTISGNQLKINSVPDYETQNSYSIRIRATDSGSLTYEEQFTLTVNDINEQTESFGGGLDAIRFATGNGLVFRGVIIKYT